MVVDRTVRRGRFNELVRRLCQSFINPLVLRGAGRKRSPFAVLRHVGRQSGNLYRVPVFAHRSGRWFIVGLRYGEDCNWCRNVLAADGCEIRWRGDDYRATDPRILRLEIVGQRLPRRQRAILGIMGISRYLMVKASAPMAATTP